MVAIFFQGITKNCFPGDKECLRKKLTDLGYSLEDYVRSEFEITLAIRMGNKKLDISQGYKIDPVNMFRHIFAALNGDKEQLRSTHVETFSDYYNIIFARNGEILP